jgi:hypothetical protein
VEQRHWLAIDFHLRPFRGCPSVHCPDFSPHCRAGRLGRRQNCVSYSLPG